MPNRVPADIAFVIKDKPHQKFKREGADIRFVHKISLRDALCGFSLKIPTLDGSNLPYKSNGIVKPHAIEKYFFAKKLVLKSNILIFRFANQGLPNPKLGGRRGDLIVEFDVRFPDALSPAAKELITNALPPN